MKSMLKSGAAVPFAHLLGLSKADAKSKAEEDEKKVDDDEERDDAPNAEAPEDDMKGEEPKEDDPKAETPKEKDEEDPDEDGDDDSDGADMAKGSKARSARMRERARCAAIFADAAAADNPALAAVLAFQTDMTRGQAIQALRAGAATRQQPKRSLHERMASVKVPEVGAGGEAPQLSLAQRIVAAAEKARGA